MEGEDLEGGVLVMRENLPSYLLEYRGGGPLPYITAEAFSMGKGGGGGA